MTDILINISRIVLDVLNVQLYVLLDLKEKLPEVRDEYLKLISKLEKLISEKK
jgi:hypothetical protein